MLDFFRNIFRALSRTEKRVLLAAAALVLAGAAGLIVFFVRENTAIVPAASGTYAEGMVGQPSHVNPVLAASDADQTLVRLLFADVEDLAESIEISPDGRTLKVHLKQGLEWSNGEPLTSDDLIFTLESIQDPDSRSPLAGLFQGVTAERKSALEVDFKLTNISLADAVRDLRPAPRHIFGDIPPANWRLSEYNLRPIASGPYVFASHDAGAEGFITAYRLTPNPRYADTRPYIQRVGVHFFHDQEELLAAFNSGQIQGFSTTNSGLLEQVQRPYALAEFTTPTVYAAFWNDTANPALVPFETRWALDLAIDRAEVVEALGGYADEAHGPFPPALLPPDPAVPAPATSTDTSTAPPSGASTTTAPTVGSGNDPARILESRGWAKGGDGVWTKRIGRADVRLAFDLTAPDIPFLKGAAENLASQWREFGAEVELNFLPPDDALLAAITNRSYDGLLFGNTIRGTGDLYPFWHSSGRFAPGLNLAIYENDRVDTLLTSLREENDPAARERDMRAVSRLIVDDEPAVFLFSAHNLFVSSRNLQGVEPGFLPNPADRLEQLPHWYVETARRFI